MLSHTVKSIALKLYRQLNTPRSLTCYILVKYGEWDQLANLRCDPAHYGPRCPLSIDRYRRDVQATDFLRKFDGLPTSVDKRQVALDNFYLAEKQCCATNLRLDRHLSYPVHTELSWQAELLIRRARRWIARTLGPLPSFLDGRFGPGTTFESKGWRHRSITAYDKLANPPTGTSGIAPFADHLIWQTAMSHAWGLSCPNRLIPTVRGNRFTTVPKDSTKDRGICIEPGLNVYGQLAVGRAMRTRLLRQGIDLKNGQDVHRQLAAQASVSGTLSTIDLSNASDTVSTSLVKLLLPDEWHEVLTSFRSPYTLIKQGKLEKWVRLEKFSSMGNGFTFELETLIFASLLHAVGGRIGHDSFVYGDDIICPREVTADLLALLGYCGFTPNPAKTFITGGFRESCGGDFLFGHDVRPFYLKEEPNDPASLISLANGLWRVSHSLGVPELLVVRNHTLDFVPSEIRNLRGPPELGDLVVTDDDESKWRTVTRNSIRYLRVWRPVTAKLSLYKRGGYRGAARVSERSYYSGGVCLAAAMLGLPSGGLSPRNAVTGYRFGRVPFS